MNLKKILCFIGMHDIQDFELKKKFFIDYPKDHRFNQFDWCIETINEFGLVIDKNYDRQDVSDFLVYTNNITLKNSGVFIENKCVVCDFVFNRTKRLDI